MPRASKVERQARALCADRATGGQPQRWRALEELDAATIDALIVSHPGFRIRLCDGKRAIGAALKATIDARPEWALNATLDHSAASKPLGRQWMSFSS
jgi:hypothetical protein